MPDTERMDVQDLISTAGGINELAHKAGVSRPTVYDWKRNGAIPGNRAARIARELELPLSEVMDLVAEPTTPARA